MSGSVMILGVRVDRLTMAEAVARCQAMISEGGPHRIVTPNGEIIWAAQSDAELRGILNNSALAVADGASVVLASRWLGQPLPQRVAGADLVEALLRAGKYRVFLLGATPESVAEAAQRLPTLFPGTTVAGSQHGYFSEAEIPAIVAAAHAAAPDVLLVGMGAGKQERFLAAHLAATGVPLGVGIGGVIDVWAGRSQRAPLWMRRVNLEWAYRIVRFGRYSRSLPPLLWFLWAVWRSRREEPGR